MPLQNTTDLLVITQGGPESLPDPTTVSGRAHRLVNAMPNPLVAVPVVYSSSGPALPFVEGGVNVATISIPPAGEKWVQSDGVRWIVTSGGVSGLLLPTVTTPVRALNAAFTPSLTRPVLGLYTVSITATAALGLLASDDGRIELRADAGAPATVRASARNRVAQLIGLLTTPQVVMETELSFLFPPGWQGMLVPIALVAAPVFAIVRQTEIVL